MRSTVPQAPNKYVIRVCVHRLFLNCAETRRKSLFKILGVKSQMLRNGGLFAQMEKITHFGPKMEKKQHPQSLYSTGFK